MAIDIISSKGYKHFKSRETRWGRYMKAQVFPSVRKAEIALSFDGNQYNCITLTKHELLKLRKLINKLLEHEDLQ